MYLGDHRMVIFREDQDYPIHILNDLRTRSLCGNLNFKTPEHEWTWGPINTWWGCEDCCDMWTNRLKESSSQSEIVAL